MTLTPEQAQAQAAIDDVLSSIQSLQQELLSEAPDISSWMRKVNTNLRQFPDLIHLLSDDQIAPLYRAIVAAAEVAVCKPAKVKAPKPPKEPKEPKAKAAKKGKLDIATMPMFDLSKLDVSKF